MDNSEQELAASNSFEDQPDRHLHYSCCHPGSAGFRNGHIPERKDLANLKPSALPKQDHQKHRFLQFRRSLEVQHKICGFQDQLL
jgi:hypothetical protein